MTYKELLQNVRAVGGDTPRQMDDAAEYLERELSGLDTNDLLALLGEAAQQNDPALQDSLHDALEDAVLRAVVGPIFRRRRTIH